MACLVGVLAVACLVGVLAVLKATRSNNQPHVYLQYYKIVIVHYDKPHMFVMIPYKCQRVQTQESVEISQTAPYLYTI